MFVRSKKILPLHYQNETRILIKNKTNMKAVEKKQETQIFYEWCYSKFEVRTKLELKGRGITKSEYNDDIYFVTPKAFQKLEKTYTCTRYDVYSLTD